MPLHHSAVQRDGRVSEALSTSSRIGLYTTPTTGTFPMVSPIDTQTKGKLFTIRIQRVTKVATTTNSAEKELSFLICFIIADDFSSIRIVAN